MDATNISRPYHRISGIVAVNMIMAGASGGVVAVAIAVWAQVSLHYICWLTRLYSHLI